MIFYSLIISALCSLALAFDCASIEVDSQLYSIKELPFKNDLYFNVSHLDSSYSRINTTISLLGNICNPLDAKLQLTPECPPDTWICQLTTALLSSNASAPTILSVKPIANGPHDLPKASIVNNNLLLDYGASLSIEFICKSDGNEQFIKSANSSDKIRLSVESPKVCKRQRGSQGHTDASQMSTAATFFLWIFYMFLGYFIIGTANNFFINKITTFPEMLPHSEFWSNSFTYCRDYMTNIIERLRGNSNYVRL